LPPSDPEVQEVGKICGGFAWELIQQLKSKRKRITNAIPIAQLER
jgi:hypothetical protein